MICQPAIRPARLDPKLYERIEQGLHQGCADMMRPDLERGVYWPAYEHPLFYVDTDAERRALSGHARAIAYLFTSVNATPYDGQRDEVRRRAEVCQLLLEAKAPCFSAAPGTGYEDDHTYAALMFCRKVWRGEAKHVIGDLLGHYVRAGVVRPDERLDSVEKRTAGRLPLEAAIELGNADAAQAMIKLGAPVDGFSLEGMTVSVVDFAASAAGGDRQAVLASVTEAMMCRACGPMAGHTERRSRRTLAL